MRVVKVTVTLADAPATVLEGVTVGIVPANAPGTIVNPDGMEEYRLEP